MAKKAARQHRNVKRKKPKPASAKKKRAVPANMESTGPHDFVPYHATLTAELDAVRNRVRLLVKHWPTDGHFKESILRQILRRHLPENMLIGTGFVVNSFGPSGEVDILIVDKSMPTLFKESELLIVTPESVRAVLEVKTRLRGYLEIRDAIQQLAERKAVVERHVRCKAWAGLFVYDGSARHEDVLNALNEVYWSTKAAVDMVAIGKHLVVKFFSTSSNKAPARSWHSFIVPGLAATNFVASLIEALVGPNKDFGTFAWFRPPAGFSRKLFLQAEFDATPQPFRI
jgi:hypothetical protein